MPALYAAWQQLQDGPAVQSVRRYPSTPSRRLLTVGLGISGIVAAAWILLLRRMGLGEQFWLGFAWDYAWMPALPLLCSVAGLYGEHTFGSMAKEVEKLRRLTYQFKRV